MTLGGLA